MNFGDRGLDSIFFKRFEDGLGITPRTPLCQVHVGRCTNHFALRRIRLSGYTCQLLLNHTKSVYELAKGFALSGVSRSQAKRSTCASDGSRAQFEASDVEDV